MIKGLLVNFLIIPVIAWTLAQIIPMEDSISTGFLLISVCAGAALSPKLAQISKSDIPFTGTMLIILSALTAVIAPIWVGVILSASGDGTNSYGIVIPTINPLSMLVGLFVLYMIPMLMGLLIYRRYPDSLKYKTLLDKVSNILIAIVVASVLVTNLNGLLTLLGSLGIVTSIVDVIIYGMFGYILGGSQIGTKRSLAFNTGLRNEAVALLIASQVFSDQPNVAVVVVVFGMMQHVIMGILALYWSKKSKGLKISK